MAFDHAGFFAIVGKCVKAVNVWNGYIAAITTAKNEIRDAYEAEDLHDLYGNVPGIAAGFQASVTAAIASLTNDLAAGLFVDRDYVVEQLPTIDRSVTGILNALYDYMIDNSLTIKSSVVSLGGVDAHEAKSASINGGVVAADGAGPRLYCSRILDGVNAPGNNVSAHERYLGVESQLARTTTVFAEIISNAQAGAEVAQLYSIAEETGAYEVQQEEPSGGGSILSPEGNNLVVSNYDFTSWTGNNPNSWLMTGGAAGTDWVDDSGTGLGGLRINTVNVKALQALPSALEHDRMYFIAVSFDGSGQNGEMGTVGITVRNLADNVDYMSQRTAAIEIGTDERMQASGFFYLPNSVDLTDVYVELHLTAKSSIDMDYVIINKVVCAPATYYNGLAWAWWPPLQTYVVGGDTYNLVSLATRNSLAISNANDGVYQTFFRRAYNIQLPTADAPSIADSGAT